MKLCFGWAYADPRFAPVISLATSLPPRVTFVESLLASFERLLILEDGCVTEVDRSLVEIRNDAGGGERFLLAETCSPRRADVFSKIKILAVRHGVEDGVQPIESVTMRAHNTRETSQPAITFKEALHPRDQIPGVVCVLIPERLLNTIKIVVPSPSR